MAPGEAVLPWARGPWAPTLAPVSQVANTKKETVFKWLKDDVLCETEAPPDLEKGVCELLIPKVLHWVTGTLVWFAGWLHHPPAAWRPCGPQRKW